MNFDDILNADDIQFHDTPEILGHGGFPEWYPMKSYPYPVPGPWSYNPQYPAGYAGPPPIFAENDDGTMTQVMGEHEEEGAMHESESESHLEPDRGDDLFSSVVEVIGGVVDLFRSPEAVRRDREAKTRPPVMTAARPAVVGLSNLDERLVRAIAIQDLVADVGPERAFAMVGEEMWLALE